MNDFKKDFNRLLKETAGAADIIRDYNKGLIILDEAVRLILSAAQEQAAEEARKEMNG